jgi:predicted restriction endonuclease
MYQAVFGSVDGRLMVRGEKKPVSIIFESKVYSATIQNNDFNKSYNESHPRDILQIRYKKDLKEALAAAFAESYRFFSEKRNLEKQTRESKRIKLPEDQREYLALYSTGKDDLFFMDAIYAEDLSAIAEMVSDQSEEAVEAELNFEKEDRTASIIEVTRTEKIRRLNRKISDNLKQLYGFRCQICGAIHDEPYGCNVAEAHHIRYFVQSLDNDASNQLIVCPNHHRIIHKTNAFWDPKKLVYTYPNGYSEGLLLNYHL